MIPQGHASVAVPVIEQLLLAPSDERRDQQAGEAQIVERLRSEAQRGHQVFHRERRAET